MNTHQRTIINRLKRSHNLKELAMESDAKKANYAGDMAQAQAGTLGGPSRERTWDECGFEQKVERLRNLLLILNSQAQMSGAQAFDAEKIAKAHQHGCRGEVMLPVIEQAGGFIAQAYGAHPFEHIKRMLG